MQSDDQLPEDVTNLTCKLYLEIELVVKYTTLQFYSLAFFEIETPAGQVDTKAGYNNELLF